MVVRPVLIGLALAVAATGPAACRSSRTTCSGGMCEVRGTPLGAEEVRRRASRFAYKKLRRRQESGAPVQDENWQRIEVRPIDPAEWEVTRTATRWRLRRYLTRDLWQVVDCRHDGSDADAFVEIAAPPNGEAAK